MVRFSGGISGNSRRAHGVDLTGAVERALKEMGLDADRARIQRRTAQVHAMWRDIVDDVIVRHTNSVYITRENGVKKLTAYVDESIYAAELNARRELIKLQFARRYGEDIDEFRIFISRGRYKKNHPFVEKEPPAYEERAQPAPLSAEQRTELSAALSRVENPALRERLEKAAVADMAWRNGIKVKNEGKQKD